MADMASLYEQHKDLSEHKQVQAGISPAGDMGHVHTSFVKTIAQLVKDGKVNVFVPATFYKEGEYEKLSESARSQADLAMINMADQLRHVVDYFLSEKTPDASPQLEQMIEQLWQMKERFETKHGTILKF